MSNIPEADQSNPEVAAVLDMVRQKRGMLGSLHKRMAHVPALVEAFEAFSSSVHKLPIEFEVFALVVLRTVQLIEDNYEWPICVSLAQKAGLADAKIIELWDWRNSSHFSPRQKAALAIIDEHCLERPATRTATAAARAHLTDPEIVAVCTVMGWFLLIGTFTTPLALIQENPAAPVLVALDARTHAN